MRQAKPFFFSRKIDDTNKKPVKWNQLLDVDGKQKNKRAGVSIASIGSSWEGL